MAKLEDDDGLPLVVMGTFIVIGSILIAGSARTFQHWLGWGSLALFFIGGGGIALGCRLVNEGKRLRQQPARTVLTQDDRSPILYFRTFEEDNLTIPVPMAPFSAFMPGLPAAHELKAFEILGPVICIANPRHEDQLGPAVLRPDGDWQKEVLQLLPKAQATIVRIGRVTTNLEWELKQVLRLASLRKLLLYFPDKDSLFNDSRRHRYERFRTEIQHLFPIPLPLACDQALFVGFDDQCLPVLILPSGIPRRYHAIQQALHHLNPQFVVKRMTLRFSLSAFAFFLIVIGITLIAVRYI